jgi:hypothetical protein
MAAGIGLLALPLAAQPSLTFTPDEITIKGFPPGATVALFGVARELGEQHVLRLQRTELLLTVSGINGEALYEAEGAIPPSSVWLAADVSTGQSVVGRPEGEPVSSLLPGLVRVTKRDRVEIDLAEVEVFVVQPSTQSSWGGVLRDGDPQDSDAKANGTVVVPVAELVETGGGGPLAQLENGDRVVAVDPNSLELTLVEVGGLP